MEAFRRYGPFRVCGREESGLQIGSEVVRDLRPLRVLKIESGNENG